MLNNTFLDFREHFNNQIDYFKRSTLLATFGPPKPFTFHSFSTQGGSKPGSASVTKPECPRVVPADLAMDLEPQGTLPAEEKDFGEGAAETPAAGAADVARTAVPPPSLCAPAARLRRESSLGERGWEAVIVHSAAYKDATASLRARLATRPFALRTRRFKNAEGFVRAFEKKREPERSVIFAEAGDAAAVLAYVSARRCSRLLRVLVIGPPRVGGQCAATACAYVRSLDAAAEEAKLVADEDDC